MELKLKFLLGMTATASILFLSACHDDGKTGNAGVASSNNSNSNVQTNAECSGSYEEKFICYANKYNNDKSALEGARKQCNVSQGKPPEECNALNMVMSAPGAVKWLGKSEPYPDRNAKFFEDTSDQIRSDEYGWCVAYNTSNKSFPFSERRSSSCGNLVYKYIYASGDQANHEKIMKMENSIKHNS